jgi:hypothetical protein
MEIIYSPKLVLTDKGMHGFISQAVIFFSVRRIHVQPEWKINDQKCEYSYEFTDTEMEHAGH